VRLPLFHRSMVSIVALLPSLWMGGIVEAEQHQKEVVLDGVSVLAGGRDSNESDASLLLLSDIELEASLILVGRYGAAGLERPLTKALWKEARRRATLILLMAAQARQLNELVSNDEKQALLEEITEQMGGRASLHAFLERIGVERPSLDKWIENAALALRQLKYVGDQVEVPSNREIEARMDTDSRGLEKNLESVRERYRELIMKEKTDEQIRQWLRELSMEGAMRVVR